MRVRRRAGDAVAVVIGREDARIEAEALLDQYVQGPQVAAGDGETRGAIGDHRLADDVFEQLARAAQVRAELGRRLPVDQAMPVTVAGNLVAGRVDGADQARLTVRDP